MASNGTRWDEVEVERMRTLAGQGLSASLIGAELHRTRNMVLGKCFRAGIMLLTRASYVGLLKDDPVPVRKRRNRAGYVRPKKVTALAERMAERENAIATPPVDRLPMGTLGGLPWPDANGCRYLTGEPSAFDWCNAPKAPHSSYCPHHRALCENIYQLKPNSSGPVRTL